MEGEGRGRAARRELAVAHQRAVRDIQVDREGGGAARCTRVARRVGSFEVVAEVGRGGVAVRMNRSHVVAGFVRGDQDVVGRRVLLKHEDLTEGVSGSKRRVGLAQNRRTRTPRGPRDAGRVIRVRLFARKHRGGHALHVSVVGTPVTRDLAQLGAGGVRAGVLRPRVGGRRDAKDRVALKDMELKIPLVDDVYVIEEACDVVRGARRVVSELQVHELVVGVDRDDPRLVVREERRAGRRRRGRELAHARNDGHLFFGALPRRSRRSWIAVSALRDDHLLAPASLGRHELVESLGAYREPAHLARVGVERDADPRSVLGFAAEEEEARARQLDLAVAIDFHDARVGRVVVASRQHHAPPHTRSDRPVVRAKAFLGRQGEQLRRERRIEGEELRLSLARRSVDDGSRATRGNAGHFRSARLGGLRRDSGQEDGGQRQKADEGATRDRHASPTRLRRKALRRPDERRMLSVRRGLPSGQMPTQRRASPYTGWGEDRPIYTILAAPVAHDRKRVLRPEVRKPAEP